MVTGALTLTYNLTTDLHTIFDRRSNCCDAPPQGECAARWRPALPPVRRRRATFETNYDRSIEAYQRQCREHGDALVEIYRTSGLLEEILRPVSLAQHIPEYAGTDHI